MSGTVTTDGEVIEETELPAEISDSSSARELIERACKLLDVPNQPPEAGIALTHATQAVEWLLKGGL